MKSDIKQHNTYIQKGTWNHKEQHEPENQRNSRKINHSAFITIKNHKPNFKTKPSNRLMNSKKSEIGRISQHILDKKQTNMRLKEKLQLNQWKAVTNWFTAITNKNNATFIQFDPTDYYTSITEYTLDRTLELRVQRRDIRINKHCRKSLFFHNNKPRIKTLNNQLFDITMGSFDRA